MNTQWKQRIVGVVVVVAVATIFMPMFFHNKNPLKSTKVAAQKEAEKTAPQIVFKSPTMLTQDNNTLLAANNTTTRATSAVPITVASKSADDASTKSTILAQKITKPASSAKPTRAITAAPKMPIQVAAASSKKDINNMILTRGAPVPTAWVLQLGTFGNAKNAERLITKLRGLGYESYSRNATGSGNQKLVRVFVGPEINKDILKSKQAELQSNLNLKGVVKRYSL